MKFQRLLPSVIIISSLGGAALLLTGRDAPVQSAETRALRLVGEMSSHRAAHRATLLPAGEVLITGGCSTNGCGGVLESVESFDPASNSFRSGPAMSTPRVSHVAVALPNGDVLVAGGWTGRATTAEAERLDRATNRFVAAGTMNSARMSPAVATLQDGRILIIGGEVATGTSVAAAELYDHASGAFEMAGAMGVPRAAHVAITLRDGRVLVTGGHRARGEVLRSAEIYDPRTGAFTPTGDMLETRHKHAAALLPDGRVLVLGGSDARDAGGRRATTEIFDPVSGSFTGGPTMRAARHKFLDAVVTLPGGAILVAGGHEQPELWDPRTEQFIPVDGQLPEALEFATATVLPDGDVLILGGYDQRIRPSAAGWRYVAQ